MASKYFLPYCIKPVFIHTNEKDVGTCGMVNGFIYAGTLSLVILIGGIRYYIKANTAESKRNIIYSIIGLLLVAWILIPIITRQSSINMWYGFQDSIRELMKQGYTFQEAVVLLQGMSQNAQLGVLNNISSMIFASRKSTTVPGGTTSPPPATPINIAYIGR